MPCAEDVSAEELAELTTGFSGAEIALVVREASLKALEEDINAKQARRNHFLESVKSIKPSITPDMLQFYAKFQLSSGLQAA